jgi:hypothetical protein
MKIKSGMVEEIESQMPKRIDVSRVGTIDPALRFELFDKVYDTVNEKISPIELYWHLRDQADELNNWDGLLP